MTAVTTEADLVLGIGTNTEYFAVAIPYDGIMIIPHDVNGVIASYANLGSYAAYSGLSVVPAAGSDLLTATTTLEEQYLTDTDFRQALVPSKDAWEWEHLIPYGDPLFDYASGPFQTNSDELTLEILGDRETDQTQLTIFKNGYNISIVMTSTWSW